MKRVVFSAITAIAALCILATSAFAWQDRIEGRPASLEPGSTAGYYFWHGDDGLHLWTTDPEHVNRTYTGTITTNGQFNNVSLQRPEGDDSFSQSGPGMLTFTFKTGDGIDGIDFQIDGGTYVKLDLARIDDQGHVHRIGVDNIFLGAYSVHPDHNPFRVDR